MRYHKILPYLYIHIFCLLILSLPKREGVRSRLETWLKERSFGVPLCISVDQKKQTKIQDFRFAQIVDSCSPQCNIFRTRSCNESLNLQCYDSRSTFYLCVTGLMASLVQTDPPKDLEDLLGRHGVDPSTFSNMMAEGWSLSTFALSATAIDAFDPLLFNSEASALQQARLRVCWREANMALNFPASSNQPAAPLTTPEGSWHENVCSQTESRAYQTYEGWLQAVLS